MTQTRKWALATAVLAAAVLVAGWFLLVSPKRSEAAELRAQRAEQRDANQALRGRLELLRGQAANLPAKRARLLQIMAALPSDPQLPNLVRTLTGAATRSGADLVSITPTAPVDVVPPAPDATGSASSSPGASAEATGTGETSTTDAAASSTDAAASTEPTALSLKAVPLTLTVTGQYVQLDRFLNLMEQTKRTFVVTDFTVTSNDQAASGPEPTAATGPLKITVTGRVFMVQGVHAAAPSASGTPAGEK